mmetsp:Transcript_29823/g.72721  ORF Transcript_29823/g.72721 Transcript_29823/m.72721 type:complete len:515 (+) Transcript_29823:40-1584(+)
MFESSSLTGSLLRVALLASAVYFFTIGTLLRHAPSPDGGGTRPDPSHTGGEIRPGGTGGGGRDVGSISIELYSEASCRGEVMRYTPDNDEALCERCADMCHRTFPSGRKMHDGVRSFRVRGPAEVLGVGWSVTASAQCAGAYPYEDPGVVRSRVGPGDACVELGGDHANIFVFTGLPSVLPSEKKTYHIAYSAESSTYFGFQAYANYYAFKGSRQEEGTGYTRLLTAGETDDLATRIPTFQAPRVEFSNRYAPINKPDVVDKWMRSPQAPKEEVIVLIDPDNWLLQPIARHVSKVSEGHALAQQAFFYKNPLVKELYQLVCSRNCAYTPDDAAVPYFVHREDLRKIAPLWRELTIKIKEMSWRDPSLLTRFKSIQIDWCAEMYGYVFAAAELGIRHTIKGHLQLRDVDTPVPKSQESKIPMIHMGRAWFPKGDKSAERWRHTEGRNFAYRGIQVWCKCNWTASHIIPWPVPSGTDFASTQTLRILHDSVEMYGPLPQSKYRGGPTRHGYNQKYP